MPYTVTIFDIGFLADLVVIGAIALIASGIARIVTWLRR